MRRVRTSLGINIFYSVTHSAQGVKLITLNDNSKESIQEITLVIPDDEDETSENDSEEAADAEGEPTETPESTEE